MQILDGFGRLRHWTEPPAWLAFRFPDAGIPAPTKYACDATSKKCALAAAGTYADKPSCDAKCSPP